MLKLGHNAGRSARLPETVGHPWEFFERRGCVLDGRGPLVIDRTSRWGYGVKVLTESHDVSSWPRMGPVVERGVTVEKGAWIGSYSVLVGCTIGAHAIVAAGTVVRGQSVGPYTMVAGNPARVVARWAPPLSGQAREGQWVYEEAGVCGFERVLE